MSLYGMMRTSVSGMQGQSNRLGTVADNIANAGTTGYKRSDIAFSTLVLPATSGYYSSGGVMTEVRYNVSQQGVIQYTPNTTDLAISGNGFFVVEDAAGTPFLTRAGSFVPDDQGRLVNAAGFYLMGYNFANGTPAPVANGLAGMDRVQIGQLPMTAVPSTVGVLTANLPRNADIVAAGDLPSANGATADFSHKRSLVVYDNLGGELLLDVYFTKSAANEWEMAVFPQDAGAPGTNFPYAGGPLVVETLTFDPATGALDAGSPTSLTIPVPGGSTLELDVGAMSQLASDFAVSTADVNGSGASAVRDIQISQDGTVFARYENGTLSALYRIPLANVASPDKLLVQSGNIFSPSGDSGDVSIGFPGQGGLGSISSGALESSNVDIATELTAMIEAQRSYTANSKVFQTGSDLMDILVNLKR